VRSLAEAMFSQDGDVPAATLDRHVDEVDAFISAASRTLRLGLRFALFVVRVAPLLFLVRLCPIERLRVDERVALLARLERSPVAPLSLAFIGWRTVTTLVFYEDPRELRALGYTSDERRVYKRSLPGFVAAGAPPRLPVPAPAESGVRLSVDDEATGAAREPAVAAPRSAREVA
jgi:hypothetical protein